MKRPSSAAGHGRGSRGRRGPNLFESHLPRLTSDATLTREEAFVRELMETGLKLLRDETGLGDIKLLNGALRELRYAFRVFAPYRHVRKVSAFGSARTPATAPAYKTAVKFSREIVERGFMVITGGGPGIMLACQEGATRAQSFGLNIRLPFEQDANPEIRNDPKLVTLRYFFTRKLLFVKEADAAVFFPGGFGTHDEAYETLTLVQTGKSRPIPLVFLDTPRGTYWKTWLRYLEEHLLRAGLISDFDLSLFKVTSSIDEAVQEIEQFYRTYHSSRFVGDEFVMRLNRPIPPAAVDRLSDEFADLIVQGRMRLTDALPDEHEQEPELDRLPRLVFAYTRTRVGRLRQLIDRLNALG